MGIGKRIIDLARANLNALMDRASADHLHELSETELVSELERRRQERSAQERERLQRVADEAAAKARGSAREKANAPRSRGAVRRAADADSRAARVRKLYQILGVQVGAPIAEIKRAYRALMRVHHPDRHAGDAAKQKAASAHAATITTAYAELETLLTKKT